MVVTLDDVHLEVSQQDESGPRAAIGSVLEGKDALRLSIRQLLLMPQGVHLPFRHCDVTGAETSTL